MPNQFIDLNGDYRRARLGVALSGSVTEDDVSDPTKLVAVIVDLQKRLVALEQNKSQEFVEFEKQVTAAGGGNVTLQHNFGCPVRYYIVHWKGAAAPSLNVNDALTTTNALVLNSLVAGRIVIRVEKSSFSVVKGTS